MPLEVLELAKVGLRKHILNAIFPRKKIQENFALQIQQAGYLGEF